MAPVFLLQIQFYGVSLQKYSLLVLYGESVYRTSCFCIGGGHGADDYPEYLDYLNAETLVRRARRAQGAQKAGAAAGGSDVLPGHPVRDVCVHGAAGGDGQRSGRDARGAGGLRVHVPGGRPHAAVYRGHRRRPGGGALPAEVRDSDSVGGDDSAVGLVHQRLLRAFRSGHDSGGGGRSADDAAHGVHHKRGEPD